MVSTAGYHHSSLITYFPPRVSLQDFPRVSCSRHMSTAPASLPHWRWGFCQERHWLSPPSGPESPHPRGGLCVCCMGLVDEGRGPPRVGTELHGRTMPSGREERSAEAVEALSPKTRWLVPGPLCPPMGPTRGPCGFRKDEARAAVGAQLCAPPAPSRLPDGLRALGPWKEPGRRLPARLGRAAPRSFLMRHGGRCGRGFSQASVEPHGRAKVLQVVQPTSHTRGSTVLSTCVRWLGLPVRENHTMSSEPPPVTHQVMPRGPAEILMLLRDLGPHG